MTLTTPGTGADSANTTAPETPAAAPGPPPAYQFQTDAHTDRTTAFTTHAMAARLPATLRRAWHLGWHADRRAVLTLTACTLAYALLTATALHSANTLLTALLNPGKAGDRLADALPALLLVTTTASTAYLADAAARADVERAQGSTETEAIPIMLALEKTLLDTAEKLELIDFTQRKQLERIRDDRHHPGHPAHRRSRCRPRGTARCRRPDDEVAR